MTIDHRKVVALATNETPFVKRVDDIDDYQVTTTVTRYTKSVWLTDKFKAAALDLNFAYNKSLADSITGNNLVTFTRASSGTYVGADGLIKTASTNEARFDHDPVTGESLGLLIEKSTTNLITSDFTVTSQASGLTLSEDSSITNPDGTTGAIKMTATAGNSKHEVQKQSTSSSTNHAHSVFVKKGNHRYIGLCQGGQSNNIHVIFDTDTKTITDDGSHNNGTFVSSGFEEYANGWFRIHVTGFTAGSSLRVFLAGSASQNGLKNWVASGDEFAYVWGVQKEAGNFTTSYIRTSGATVTRATDVAEITGTNFSSFYNQSEGTIFFENAQSSETHIPFAYDFSDGTTENSHRLLYISTIDPTPIKVRTNTSNSNVVDFSYTAPPVGQSQALAYAYKDNDFALSVNGASVVSDTTGTVPTVINKLTLGNAFSGVNAFSGHIKRLAYFSTRQLNATLQLITS